MKKVEKLESMIDVQERYITDFYDLFTVRKITIPVWTTLIRTASSLDEQARPNLH